ncbi:MAG: hypothetical protein F6K21_38730 [Symploca sp. SIO2D2]|nr:hypothetical protein [Symploca sp. SIO2D2]
MATKNPKISVYVPDSLKEKLLEKKEELRSKSVSAVVVTILEEYFGIAPAQNNTISNAWAEQVNVRLEELESQVNKLSKKPEQHEGKEVKVAEALQLSLDPTEEKSSSKVTQEETQSEPEAAKSEVTQSSEKVEKEDVISVSTPEVTKLTGINRNKLRYTNKTGKLPIDGNGWRILEYEGKRTVDGRSKDFWKVTKTPSATIEECQTLP